MYNTIPLSDSIIDTFKNRLYYYATITPFITTTQDWNFTAVPVSLSVAYDLSNTTLRFYRSFLDIDRQNYYPFVNNLPPQFKITDEFITMMPLDVWSKFKVWVDNKPMRSRNSYTKLYLYMYHNIHKSGFGWSHAVTQIKGELGIQGNELTSRIQELVAAGFITRTNYNKDDGIARTYGMPDELRTEGWKILNDKNLD